MARMLDGTNWFEIHEAARQSRVRVETIRQWVNRDKVSSVKINGTTWVCYDEVADCERAWRQRAEPA